MLTISGRRPARSSGSAARINSAGAKKFTSIMRRKRSALAAREQADRTHARVVDQDVEAAQRLLRGTQQHARAPPRP